MKEKVLLSGRLIFRAAVLLAALILYFSPLAAKVIDVYSEDSIQEVINDPNITIGDIIIVHAGTYYENITFWGKAITIKSKDPNDWAVVVATIIDGNQAGSVVTFNNEEGSGSVLCGITVQNGDNGYGGGIYCGSSSPSIIKCIITGNSSDWGGGICCDYSSSPSIINCTITDNSTIYDGGGICCDYSSSPSITDCIISGNSASCGGGIECLGSSSPTIINCIISGNSASSDNDGGGGIYCQASSPSIINCIITGNSGEWGGGIECYDYSFPTISNCVITGNSATWGGGIQCYSSSPNITNCTISGNSAFNGGGIDCFEVSSPIITNCILWGDWPEEISIYDDNSIPIVTYSNLREGYEGEGNINAYPLFVDPNTGDYHLMSNSPCIDIGDPNTSTLPSTDKDGNPRIINGKPDMGAYEYIELFTLYSGFNLEGFPQGLKRSSLADQNISLLKVMTYQPETSHWRILGPSDEKNFSLSLGEGWLVYVNQEEPRTIDLYFPDAGSSLEFDMAEDLFPGGNLLNFYSLSEVINSNNNQQLTWSENLFKNVSQEAGKKSISIFRYDSIKGKWQAQYQFFDRTAGPESELKKEGYIVYLQ